MENPRLRNEIDRLKIVSIYTVNKHKRKPKRQSRMDNPNTQATQNTNTEQQQTHMSNTDPIKNK